MSFHWYLEFIRRIEMNVSGGYEGSKDGAWLHSFVFSFAILSAGV